MQQEERRGEKEGESGGGRGFAQRRARQGTWMMCGLSACLKQKYYKPLRKILMYIYQWFSKKIFPILQVTFLSAGPINFQEWVCVYWPVLQ